MYLDYILFAAGGGFLLVTLALAFYLFFSRRKSQDYRRRLQEETERLDVVSTMRSTQAESGKTELPSQSDSPATVLMDPRTELCTDTELLPEKKAESSNVIQRKAEVPGIGLDLSPLQGKYELLREIHGGGMSRIFLARHAKLGNEWIVKYVARAELAGEAEVLKKLNHISLPQIIDIFQTNQGAFLVERYIEGYSLADVLALDQEIRESQVCDWGLQLAQVLHYLHNLETPIIHCDLKPSNIMVTYDNRLVLIDFGISKQQGVSDGIAGITYRYAAPEQFRGYANRPEMIRKYFGFLPPEHDKWPIDCRTDLYSVGVILRELAAGRNGSGSISSELSEIIKKCLQINPNDRFPSAKALAEALESIKGRQVVMAKSLVLRRVMAACCGICLAGGMITSASAVYVNRMENLAIVSMNPGRAVVTVQQGVQLLIQKTTPNGKETFLDPSRIEWSYSGENIARVDGDRLVGLNVGETVLYGQYRNKVIELVITVTEPPEETTAVALRYADDAEVSVYAGSGERDFTDGSLNSASFVSPESMMADSGTLYLTDSGMLRVLEGGRVTTLSMEPAYLTADAVRVWNGTPYILTGPWETDDGSWYGFASIQDGKAEVFYQTEAAWSTITDFAFSSDGALWFIQQNMALGGTVLNRLDSDTGETEWVMDLPEGTQYMAVDAADNLYLSVPEQGVLLRVGAGESEWTYFAGVENERHFVDGSIPQFYRPTSLAVDGDTLYVLDFDTVRRITIADAGALFTETLAGVPVEDTNPIVKLGAGSEASLSASERAALALDGEQLLLSDPKNSVIYEIVTRR